MASRDELSSVFLVGRVCKLHSRPLRKAFKLQRTAFQVIAVAESAYSFKSFAKGFFNELDNGLKIFGAPIAFKNIMISHMKDKRYFIDSFQLNLNIHEMASISMVLNTQSSLRNWCWKTEKMTTIATASMVKS